MSQVEVYFATNRDFSGEEPTISFGNRFNAEGPQFIRFGKGYVEKRDDGTYRYDRHAAAPESPVLGADGKPILGSLTIFEELRLKMKEGKMDTLILIHGFANSFQSSLERAAEIKEKYANGQDMNIFVFSWPSNGKVQFNDYHSDRDDARLSGTAMARAFMKLHDFLITAGAEKFCQQRIHLVAHSMGNYALRHALQAIRSEVGNALPRLLDNVFLMAADEDDDAFEYDHKLRLLPDIAKQVLVYFSSEDRALCVSDITKSNPDRLGSNGPRLVSGLPRKVTLVDCRYVDWTELNHGRHQYYRLREEVIHDVRQVLEGVPTEEFDGREFVPDRRAWRIKSSGPKAPRDELRIPREQMHLS